MPQDFWLDLAWKPYYGWERRKRGIWFLQKNRARICVSVSAHSGFGDVFTCCLSLWWDVHDSLPVPDPIWTTQLSLLLVSAAKQVFTSREQRHACIWSSKATTTLINLFDSVLEKNNTKVQNMCVLPPLHCTTTHTIHYMGDYKYPPTNWKMGVKNIEIYATTLIALQTFSKFQCPRKRRGSCDFLLQSRQDWLIKKKVIQLPGHHSQWNGEGTRKE